MWSFTPKTGWVEHSSTITRKQLLGDYGHVFNFPTSVKPLFNSPERSEFKCLDLVTQEIKTPVTRFTKEDFKNYGIKFNTRNNDILESKDYKVTYGDLHRKNQNYVVEVFLLPAANDPDTFMLIDSISIKDLTMKKLSERYVTGPKSNPLLELNVPDYKGIETRLNITKEELLAIFKYFNKLSGKGQTVSETSRDDTKTQTIMGRDGGSKLTYRYLTDFFKPKFVDGFLDEIKIYEGGGEI